MAKVEVDEAEWTASQQVVSVFSDMLKNPQAREQVLKAKKLARPNEPIPEIDAASKGYEEINKLREELAADRKAREDADKKRDDDARVAKFQADWDAQKAALRADGWMDDGIAKIEEYAKTTGIPDLEAAALKYRKLHPEPEPVQPSGYGRWAFMDEPGDKDNPSFVQKLLQTKGESESVLDSEIRNAINEVRGVPQRR